MFRSIIDKIMEAARATAYISLSARAMLLDASPFTLLRHIYTLDAALSFMLPLRDVLRFATPPPIFMLSRQMLPRCSARALSDAHATFI